MNPVPSLTGLAPSSKVVGDPAFTLKVYGSGFVVGFSTVRWNGSDRPTTFVSNNELQAAISATDIDTVGSFNVTVFNGPPGGGESNALKFTIDSPSASDKMYMPLIHR